MNLSVFHKSFVLTHLLKICFGQFRDSLTFLKSLSIIRKFPYVLSFFLPHTINRKLLKTDKVILPMNPRKISQSTKFNNCIYFVNFQGRVQKKLWKIPYSNPSFSALIQIDFKRKQGRTRGGENKLIKTDLFFGKFNRQEAYKQIRNCQKPTKK